MPNNMPDARAINEALRRAREMQSRAEPAAQAPLDLLLKDKERTLILALLILLSGEGGNTELLFALMYLLI